MSKGFIITLGTIATGIAVVLLYPVVSRNPGMSRDQHEIQAIKMALKCYKLEYSEYPTGDIETVIAALSGQNLRKIAFLELLISPQERNTKALDPWGTPYQIQIISNDVVVSSAGPDRTFGSSDDRKTR